MLSYSNRVPLVHLLFPSISNGFYFLYFTMFHYTMPGLLYHVCFYLFTGSRTSSKKVVELDQKEEQNLIETNSITSSKPPTESDQNYQQNLIEITSRT